MLRNIRFSKVVYNSARRNTHILQRKLHPNPLKLYIFVDLP